MKRIRNIILAIAAVSVLLLLCFTIYYQISLRKADNAPIHNSANWLVKLDGVELFKSVYSELLRDNSEPQLEDSSHFRIVHSITLPINLYAYNITDDPTGFFTSFILQDEKVLRSNLKHQNTWTIVDDSNNIFKHKKSNLYIGYNKQRVFMAWNTKEAIGIKILQDLIYNRNTSLFRKSKFATAFQENKILTATNLKDVIYVDGKQDSLLVSGTIEWNKLKYNEVHFSNTQNTNTSLSICVHKNGKINFPNILTVDTNTTSFFNSFNNNSHINVALRMLDTLVKYEDTEIKYEYDENFDQIKTTKIAEKNIPWLQFIYQEGEKLGQFNDPRGNKIDQKYFPFFPIYQVPFHALSNVKNDRVQKQLTKNNCAFNIHIDINKIEKLEDLKQIKTFLAPFNVLYINGTTISENEIKLSGFLTIDEQNGNALKTIYKQFKL